MAWGEWAGINGDLGKTILNQSQACIRVYREDPSRIEQDARIELTYSEGGYRYSQLNELLQNATDALRSTRGRIQVVLTDRALYVANEGSPVSRKGVGTLLASHLSRKTEEEIGQYGLGFKSVLAVSNNPAIFSRSGSFTFDREWARRTILDAGLTSPEYPVLRLARPIKPEDAAASDPALRELMGWATTVVKVPLLHGRDLLARDLASFRAEFLLFAPQVTEVSLEDRSSNEVRTMRLEGEVPTLVLIDNGKRSSWFVSRVDHRPTTAALRDAGKLAQRSLIGVAWAAPLTGAARNELGEFWAHFPTGMRTTLAGIVNAPWKLSGDRLTMLDGAYNRELLQDVLPRLVCQALPSLISKSDPAAFLDLLPARGRESRSLGDEILNAPVMEAVARTSSLPDRTGTLRQPRALSLHPPRLPSDWLGAWLPDDPARWVHASVDSTAERRAKADRLIHDGGGGSASLSSWLEAAVQPPTPERSARALTLAAQILKEDGTRNDEVRASRIVLLEDGRLGRPVRGRIFVRDGHAADEHDFVHQDLLADPGIEETLAALGIEVLDPAGELRAVLQRNPRLAAWGKVWPLTTRLDTEAVISLFREELPAPLTESVYARARSGKWHKLAVLFTPGDVIPSNSTTDADYVVDPSYHGTHLTVLERCGCVSSPRLLSGSDEPWLRVYREKVAERYRASISGPKPAIDKFVVTGPDIPWPLETLPVLSPSARASVTGAVLRLGPPEQWTVRHTSSRQYSPKRVSGPLAARLRDYGVLHTTIGPVAVQLCLRPDASVPDVFPKADVSEAWAEALALPDDLARWTNSFWENFIRDSENRRSESVATVYAWAARHEVPRPKQLMVPGIYAQRKALREAESIAITSEAEVARSLTVAGIPTLLMESSEDVESMLSGWGMADGREMRREQIVPVPDSEPVLLIDRFPPLRLYDSLIPDLEHLELQTCTSIDIFVSTPQGQQTRQSDRHRDGNLLLIRNGTDHAILDRLSRLLRVAINTANVIEDMERQASDALTLKIRASETPSAKLVLAVGGAALRRHVPATAISDLEANRNEELGPEELAELALSAHGFSILQVLLRDLDDAGLNPPSRWAGGREARRFVENLGFPLEYAGFAQARLDATVDVEGTVALPPLHDYQEKVVTRVRSLLQGDSEHRRGMVTLPTGAGKTRVAVEAVVMSVVQGEMKGPVVWIGQTEELCEQAVQAWSYVWRALGSGPMEISRFWSNNDSDEADLGVFQVVVCTIDKLKNAVDNSRYEWLVHPSLIIIDEAHASITPAYTKVLRWLGESYDVRESTTPRLGLTATAFRGHNEAETERLVRRYDSNKLDSGVFGDEEPYSYLQKRGVLARVQQKLLDGIDITVPEAEREQFEQMRRLSADIEAQVGRNAHRNRTIIESLLGQPDDWTTLLFATSVEHASALAAELSYYGLPARPINSGTDPALRRRYVEQFRAGEIRVLTNFNVLSQGFDAPKVQAVYVTRPTFSPNLYQQMIGRGLRGPLNGGSEEVLIVNIADNLIQYGEQLAFHHFDYLWSRENGWA